MKMMMVLMNVMLKMMKTSEEEDGPRLTAVAKTRSHCSRLKSNRSIHQRVVINYHPL
jgi:hypothetical protein